MPYDRYFGREDGCLNCYDFIIAGDGERMLKYAPGTGESHNEKTGNIDNDRYNAEGYAGLLRKSGDENAEFGPACGGRDPL